MLYGVKLISVNIEENKHLGTVLPFIEKELPDVLCLQEVCEDTLSDFKELGYQGGFAPMACVDSVPVGTALLTHHSVKNIWTYYYRGSQHTVCDFDRNNVSQTQQKALLYTDILIADEVFTVATTHFTWTPHGPTPSPEQISDMEKFLAYTTTLKPHIMCGDFNIPRHHNYLYKELVRNYTDTIPEHYASSLDKSLHKLGGDLDKKEMFDSFMVDYLFTQPPYKASDVRLQFGVSDHAGIVATITRASSGILE